MAKELSKIRQAISDTLKQENLSFVEDDTRMNYGFMGHLLRNGKIAVVLFPCSFHVHTPDLTLNEKTLSLIRVIQAEFKELTRDADNKVTPIKLGVE